MQRCINTDGRWQVADGRCTWQDYNKIVDTAFGLEKLKEFDLGLEEVWERECSSDSDVDKVSLTNRSCHLTTSSVSSRLHKEF